MPWPQVVHYIHLNPVRARVVPAERLLDFKWSSLPLFVAGERPACLEAATLLSESGGLPDSAGGWRRYVDCLGVLAEEEPELQDELRKQSGQAKRFELLGSDREAWRLLRQEGREEKLQVAARAESEFGEFGLRKTT